jgi:hypothetical protein
MIDGAVELIATMIADDIRRRMEGQSFTVEALTAAAIAAVEAFEQSRIKADIIVERDEHDPNRLNVFLPLDWAHQWVAK